MLDTNLKAYIDSLKILSPRPLEGDVKIALQKVGWSEDQIKESLLYYGEKKLASPSVSVAPTLPNTSPILPKTLPALPNLPEKPLMLETVNPMLSDHVATPISGDLVEKKTESATPLVSPAPEMVVVQKKPNPGSFPPSGTGTLVPKSGQVLGASPFRVMGSDVKSVTGAGSPLVGITFSNKKLASESAWALPQNLKIPAKQASKDVFPKQGSPQKKSGLGTVFAFGISLLLIAGGGFVGFAYLTNWGPFEKPPYTKETAVAGLFEKIFSTNNANYQLAISLQTKDRDQDATPFTGGNILANNFPESIDGSLITLGGISRHDGIFDGRASISGDVSLPNSQISLAVDFLKKGTNYFARATKFSNAPVDVSSLQNQWVKTTEDEFKSASQNSISLANLLSNVPFFSRVSKTKSAEKQISDEIGLLLQIASEEAIFTVTGGPEKEIISDALVAYKYSLGFDKAKVISGYKRALSEFKKRYGVNSVLQLDAKTQTYLSTKEFGEFFEYLSKNNALTVWVGLDGQPIKALLSSRIVPNQEVGVASSTEAVSQKQIDIKVTLALTDINTAGEINEPEDSVRLEEALLIFSGRTKEDYLFEKQVKSVGAITEALASYKKYAGRYPVLLSDLMKKRSEIRMATSSGAVLEKAATPFLATVPKDIFTGKDFVYSVTGFDFAFEYQIALPVYATSSAISPYYVKDSGKVPKLLMKFVSGKNTAHAGVLSAEATLTSKADLDKDGVPDALEMYIGTNKAKKDTDGDKIPDIDEILKGQNPLGDDSLSSESTTPVF